MLHAHLDVDPIKIVEESSQRCGFEAYRLLSRAYDRYTPEAEVALFNNVLQMQQWSVKGIKQAESMMREAKARIAIWQKRTKSLRAQQEPGMMIVICALLFSKFDSDVRKDVLNAAGRDSTSKDADSGLQNGTPRAMIEFEYMKSIVELVKRVDDQQKPSPMELGSFAEAHYHTQNMYIGTTKEPQNGKIHMRLGHPSVHEIMTPSGVKTHSVLQPLPRLMPPIKTPLMP